MIADALTSMGFIDINSQHGTPVAINTLPWSRPEILSIPTGEDAGSYSTTTGELGVSEFTTSPITNSAAVSVKEIHADVFELENIQFRVTISGGVMTSIYDKNASREVVPPGQKANQLVIFDDKPLYWQAWDVEVYHLDSRSELTPSTTSITEQSAYLCSVTTATKISEKSSIRTTVSLRAAHPGEPEKITPIEVTADVVWHEDKKFLKVEFPVDVRNTSASYECQYGIVTRPTHYNTTWDMVSISPYRLPRLPFPSKTSKQLTYPSPGQIRSLLPQMGRPLRILLRRLHPQRLQIRLRHPRQRDASLPAAGP